MHVPARTGSEEQWSQYLHELDKTRLELEGELSLRIARGLSVAADVNASRIRDQLSLPARGATPEEVLLRLRRPDVHRYEAHNTLTASAEFIRTAGYRHVTSIAGAVVS